MTTKQKSDSEIIAKFLEMRVNHNPVKGSFTPTKDTPHLYHDFIKEESWYFYPEFHSSWDWLIPACQKFILLRDFDTNGNRNPYFAQRINELKNAVSTFNIDITFSELVKCIEWYNKEKVSTKLI